MKAAAIVILALALHGCHAWQYGTRPVLIDGKRYRVLCPDPPPQHPNIFIGSTPCVREEVKP